MRAELQQHSAEKRSDNRVGDLPPDWAALGARIRQVALAATVMHLIEGAAGDETREAMLETSRAKPGG